MTRIEIANELAQQINELEIEFCPESLQAKVDCIIREYFVGRSVKDAWISAPEEGVYND